MKDSPYYDYASFLKRYFVGKVQKISVNAGFSCPNRDGTIGVGGCTYCNNHAFTPSYTFEGKSVREQIQDGIQFFGKKYPQMEYLAYFQSFTNTYAPIKKLLPLYKEALGEKKVVGIVIGTRPDVLPEELLMELSYIAKEKFVMLELGVETPCDETLRYIHRGHTFQQAVEGIERARRWGLLVGIHIILGLPGEDKESMISYARTLSKLPIQTLKLHQLQIIRNTPMQKDWEMYPERYHLFSPEEYLALCMDFLCNLRGDICVERFLSSSPVEELIAPKWGIKNYEFVSILKNRMLSQNLWQGKFYE
ncbi:MAG TPA: TIGR01212 family radical SAM protein [Porphyromonadaceae bacterium]|nr:TIGR01212 family radical SAM protein [Porphyromonadaceae bacterium]